MKLMRAGLLCSSCLALGLVGCYHHHYHEEAVYVQPQPYVVAPTPPPPVIVEPQPYAPAPNYHWVPGYWAWQNGRYGWVRGYWVVPPRGYHEWVAPRYERHGHEYHYHPGYWR